MRNHEKIVEDISKELSFFSGITHEGVRHRIIAASESDIYNEDIRTHIEWCEQHPIFPEQRYSVLEYDKFNGTIEVLSYLNRIMCVKAGYISRNKPKGHILFKNDIYSLRVLMVCPVYFKDGIKVRTVYGKKIIDNHILDMNFDLIGGHMQDLCTRLKKEICKVCIDEELFFDEMYIKYSIEKYFGLYSLVGRLTTFKEHPYDSEL